MLPRMPISGSIIHTAPQHHSESGTNESGSAQQGGVQVARVLDFRVRLLAFYAGKGLRTKRRNRDHPETQPFDAECKSKQEISPSDRQPLTDLTVREGSVVLLL